MTPHEEMEAQLTALLLGELPEHEATSVRERIAAEPELARLHDRLKQTIGLVREAAVSPAQDARAGAEAPKLSAERREQLLATFKTVSPRELRRPAFNAATRRELFALAAMIVALFAVGALMFGPSHVRQNSLLPAGSFARWKEDSEEFVAQESEQLGREKVLSELRPIRTPASPPPEPATDLPPPEPVRLQLHSSALLAVAPAKVPQQVADFPAPSLPAGETTLALALQTPPPAAQPPSASDEFKSIPARRSNIALPVVEDSLAAVAEGENNRQLARKDSVERQSGLASDGRQADRFGSTAGQGSGGRGGGLKPAAGGTGPAEPQMNWRFAGGEYAGVSGAGSGSAPIPGAAPLPALQNPTSQSLWAANLDGIQLKGADFGGAVALTNAIVVGAKFADVTTQMNDDFFFAELGGFAGRNTQPLDRRNESLNQSQFGIAPMDALGDSQRSAFGRDASGSVNRFYSFSGVANEGAVGEQKREAGDDLMKRDGKLAELSKDKKLGVVTGGTALAFDAQTGKPLEAAQKEMENQLAKADASNDAAAKYSEQLNLEKRYREASAQGEQARRQRIVEVEQAWAPPIKRDLSVLNADAAPKSRVEIALPHVERGEVAEKLQVASGPVATSEPTASANRPAPVLGDVALVVEESKRRLVDQHLSEAKSLNQLSDLQAISEHDQPTGTVDREANVSLEVARLSRDIESLGYLRGRVVERLSQEKVGASIPKTGIVEIIDKAEPQPDERPTLLGKARQLLSGTVERSVRVSARKDSVELRGLNAGTNTFAAFDPYWIQTEAEAIQSKIILDRVATQLNLSETWAGKHGGGTKLSTEQTRQLLKRMTEVRQDPKTSLIDIKVKSDSPEEAATIANAIAEVYREHRAQRSQEMVARGVEALGQEVASLDKRILETRAKLERLKTPSEPALSDANRPALAPTAAVPQPEVATADNAFSTFSLNVSDVSFKLAAASLEKGQMPDPAAVRSEEFINAFDYRDPEPAGRAPIAFAWERARYLFAHDRDLVRLSVKTAASGRQPGRPLNLVLLLDNSGSMERADRLRIRQECLRVLAGQLRPEDRVSVVAFARTARLWVDGLPGAQAGELPQRVGSLTPEGGTNLEDAMNLAYQTALRHFQANGVNRVVLLTDGAANLGDVQPESLKKKVEGNRRQGIALDCFGLGWDGYNDDLLEVLSRNGDGRYGFINTPEAAASDFAGQLAGALKVAASDVKVQVEWNPRRVTAYRQIGYAKHQLKKEQFRDNTVDAAEIGATEAGNALYVVQVNPRGEGPLGTMRVRFKVPGTGDYREHEWPLAYDGAAKSLEKSSPTLRLAGSASAFSEWLVSSPYAAEVTPDRLLGYLSGVPEQSAADPRPKKLEWMIRQAKSLSGK